MLHFKHRVASSFELQLWKTRNTCQNKRSLIKHRLRIFVKFWFYKNIKQPSGWTLSKKKMHTTPHKLHYIEAPFNLLWKTQIVVSILANYFLGNQAIRSVKHLFSRPSNCIQLFHLSTGRLVESLCIMFMGESRRRDTMVGICYRPWNCGEEATKAFFKQLDKLPNGRACFLWGTSIIVRDLPKLRQKFAAWGLL